MFIYFLLFFFCRQVNFIIVTMIICLLSAECNNDFMKKCKNRLILPESRPPGDGIIQISFSMALRSFFYKKLLKRNLFPSQKSCLYNKQLCSPHSNILETFQGNFMYFDLFKHNLTLNSPKCLLSTKNRKLIRNFLGQKLGKI